MPVRTLEDPFLGGVNYHAERKIISGPKKITLGAQGQDLKTAFGKRPQETEGQVERLVLLNCLENPPKARPARRSTGFLRGTISEGFKDPPTIDAGLLPAAQKSGAVRDRALRLAEVLSNATRQERCRSAFQSHVAGRTNTDRTLPELAEARTSQKCEQKAA